jgi:hypothetical protein
MLNSSLIACRLMIGSSLMTTPIAVLENDFTTDPTGAGWTYVAPEGNPSAVGWSDSGRSAGRLLLPKGGEAQWESPPVRSKPFTYYRLTFRARASDNGYWAVFFDDKAGKPIISDVYSQVYKSASYRPYDVCLRGRARAVAFRVRFGPWTGDMAVDNVCVTPIACEEAARWADGVYRPLPAVHFTPAPDRLQYIPKSMTRLRAGRTLRLVMLGDSIINDTSSSAFELLIERKYPGSKIEVATSVRGSTGCGYYQGRGRVREFICSYKPDLLLVGGISHKGDVDAIRSVVRQVRRACDCEIMLMTGAIGKKPCSAVFRKALKKLADDERTAFLDMRGAWTDYVKQSPRPEAYFKRDPVHGNDRGKQIVGRILEQFFTP